MKESGGAEAGVTGSQVMPRALWARVRLLELEVDIVERRVFLWT